jgi:hypothetical protein
MCHRRAIPLALALSGWLVAGAGSGVAWAQMRALPPTTAFGPDGPGPLAAPLDAAEVVPYDGGGNLFEGTLDAPFAGQAVDLGVRPGRSSYLQQGWTWQMLPDGLLYRAYLAGGRESRFASNWFYEKDAGWLWDIALGGHVGMLRYGTSDPIWPEGFQLDIEGAAFPRLTLGDVRDLTSVDFRFGVPLTFRQGRWEAKFGYYHLSSHLGDEHMVAHATLDRINYSRDVLVTGVALLPHPDVRVYAEAGWAFYIDGGSQPWEFQFGIEFSPAEAWSALGTPFFAVNTRVREEVDFGGNLTVETGLQWPGQSGQLFRVGLHYFNGKSDQYQFFREHEEQIGVGAWYDY